MADGTKFMVAIALCGNLTVRSDRIWQKLLQYAQRVWGIVFGYQEERVNQAIAKTCNLITFNKNAILLFWEKAKTSTPKL